MKKRIIGLFFLISVFFLFINSTNAVVYTSSNNPGTGGGGSSGGASGGTKWPTQFRAIRIRVFRKNEEGAYYATGYSGYYYITSDEDNCKSSVTARLCETTSYNYSSVASSSGASCGTSATTINMGCIVKNNLSDTFYVRSYNGTYLEDHLKANGYINLKDALSGIGYNDSIAKNGDIVIVEPVTRVKCAGIDYFGTSTAMMKMNVSYKGKSGNLCSGDDSWNGWTFSNLFRSMSQALKVTTKNWSKDSDGDTTSTTNTNYSGFGYFKYNVSDIFPPPDPVEYRLDINVCLDGGTTPIWSGFTDKYGYFDFKINGVYKKYSRTDGSGKKTEYDWIEHMQDHDTIYEGTTTYEISNIGALSGYEYIGHNVSSNGNCNIQSTSNSISGTLTQEYTSINLIFSSNCGEKLESLKKADGTYDVEDLFNLYKSEQANGKDYRNLLNISSPSCTSIDAPSKKIKNLTCLSGSTLSHANFHELNLSQYDESITDIYGNYIGFCLSSIYLKNNLGVQSFYSKSGQLLVKESNNQIEIYNSKYKPVRVCGTDVATSTIKKMCYVLEGNNYDIDSDDDVIVRFGDNNLDGHADRLPSSSTNQVKSSTTTNKLHRYEYEKKIKYSLNTINVEKMTGKYTNDSTGNIYIKGITSNFNNESLSGTILFDVTYRGKIYGVDESLCTYQTTPELVDEKIQLVFRTIDTKIPFNRTPNTNWNDGSNQGDYNNEFVNNYIINSINSYGLDKNGQKQEPIYKIELTPSDIKNIREYNKEVPYDNYEVDCETDLNGNEVCSNTFIENLKQAKVVLYEDDGDVKKTLSNSNGLEINNVFSNKIMSTNSNTIPYTEINGVNLNTKICFPVTSSAYGNVPNGNYNLGDEYQCNVAKGVTYNFFVIGTCGEDKVNMIMSENLKNASGENITVSWMSISDYSKYSSNEKYATKGPRTLLSKMEELTSNWNNIVSYNYTLIDEKNDLSSYYKDLDLELRDAAAKRHKFIVGPDTEIYSPIELENVKTRLLTRNEANLCGCTRVIKDQDKTETNCAKFLIYNVGSYYSGTGYWLSNATTTNSAHDILDDHGDGSIVTVENSKGIRPVITVYKSQISN